MSDGVAVIVTVIVFLALVVWCVFSWATSSPKGRERPTPPDHRNLALRSTPPNPSSRYEKRDSRAAGVEQAPAQWQEEVTPQGRVYRGVYELRLRGHRRNLRFPGELVEKDGKVEVYLYNPPRVIRLHPHGHCWQRLPDRDPWHKLHWEQPPDDIRTARSLVEFMLEQSYFIYEQRRAARGASG